MATLKSEYKGELRVESTHLASGTKLITDAPIDNCGKGEAFSPTDLCVAALSSCVLTIMGIKAQNMGISIEGTQIEATKIMNTDPRRIGEIEMTITMPSLSYTDKEKKILEKVVESCPVFLSLHPDIKKQIKFIWS